jgi:hypothetical protein
MSRRIQRPAIRSSTAWVRETWLSASSTTSERGERPITTRSAVSTRRSPATST